jgi:hypothetical protein
MKPSDFIDRTKNMDYNTGRGPLRIPEFGRNIQLLVEYIIANMPDRDERNRAALTMVNLMAQQNPQLKNQPEFMEKIWDQLFMISGYQLDVDSPFPIPDVRLKNLKRPGRVQYPTKALKYHFYGKNIVMMIKKALEMEEGEAKQKYIAIIAGYMKLSYKTWNDDKVSDELIIRHLAELSGGQIVVDKVSDTFFNGKQIERTFTKDFRKNKPRWFNNNKRSR